MPRTPRNDFAGTRHHVMNRTVGRRAFRTDADRALFLGLLAELPGRFAVSVVAWALMPTHYHLLLEDRDGRLGEAMAWFNGQLARTLNRRRNWRGALFRARYRNRVVLDEAYWRNALAYVHLNPVRSGAVSHPDESIWTSHRAYIGLETAPSWLAREEQLGLYGTLEAYQARIGDLVRGSAQLPPEWGDDRVWVLPSTQGVNPIDVPPAVTTIDPDAGLAQVAELTGVPVEELLQGRRGRTGNLPRALACWWLGRACGMTRVRIAEKLGTTPLAVAGAANRVRADKIGRAHV